MLSKTFQTRNTATFDEVVVWACSMYSFLRFLLVARQSRGLKANVLRHNTRACDSLLCFIEIDQPVFSRSGRSKLQTYIHSCSISQQENASNGKRKETRLLLLHGPTSFQVIFCRLLCLQSDKIATSPG